MMFFGKRPPLVTWVEVEFGGPAFIEPQPWYIASGRHAGRRGRICYICFGVSPLLDRIYIRQIWVDPRYRLQKYTTAMLRAVVKHASPAGWQLPITPICDDAASVMFWNRVRRREESALLVTPHLRRSEMDVEAARWRNALNSISIS